MQPIFQSPSRIIVHRQKHSMRYGQEHASCYSSQSKTLISMVVIAYFLSSLLLHVDSS